MQIERRAAGDAEPVLHRHRRGGKGVVRRRGRHHDQVDGLRIDAGIGDGGARSGNSQMRGELAGCSDVALTDAGALHDPFVGGVDHPRKIVIAEDALRQIGTAAEHDRTQDAHEATSPILIAESPAPLRPSVCSIFASRS